MRGQLSQEAYEQKVADIEKKKEDFEEKRQQMELDQAKQSFEKWDNVKQFAAYTGLVVIGSAAAACAVAVAAAALAPVAYGTAFCGGVGIVAGHAAKPEPEKPKKPEGCHIQ